MADLTINVQLPFDRTRTGLLTLTGSDGATLAGPFEVLGKSDNARAAKEGNASRDPTLPFGDTPAGTYSVPRIIDTGSGTNYSLRSYGPHEAIVLKPESGEAVDAAKNGRVGLLVHSGDLGKNGRLRATHGCLRLSNEEMKSLLDAIRAATNNDSELRCEAARVSVIVGGEADEGAGADESDPPPGIDDLLNPLPLP